MTGKVRTLAIPDFPPPPPSPMPGRVLDRIRQRQSLFRLAFDDRRVTRAMLRAQAVEFEAWLATLEPR